MHTDEHSEYYTFDYIKHREYNSRIPLITFPYAQVGSEFSFKCVKLAYIIVNYSLKINLKKSLSSKIKFNQK